MPTLPEKLIEAIRDLDDVQRVNYTGYSIDEEDVTDADRAAAAENDQELEEDAKKEVTVLSMSISMKSGLSSGDIAVIGGENAEEGEAES